MQRDGVLAGERVQQMTKVACLRTVVLGAPLRDILKHLATRTVAPDADNLVALMHRPRQAYFLIPQVIMEPVFVPDKADLYLLA